MWDLIESLLPSWLLDPRRIVTAVRNLIAYVHDLFRGAFDRVKAALVAEFPWMAGFFDALDGFMSNVFLWAHWLIFQMLPALAHEAYNGAVSVAQTLLARVVGLIQQALDTALSYARALWHAAMVELVTLRDWAYRTVAGIVVTVAWLLGKVGQLLTDPGVLSAWLVGAMVTAIGKYLLANDRRLARIAWRILLPAALFAAHEAESVITDIF